MEVRDRNRAALGHITTEHTTLQTLTKRGFSTASLIFIATISAVILIGSCPIARVRILNSKLLLDSAWMVSGSGAWLRRDRSSWRSIVKFT